ncbi:MAG: DUF5711 family protein [Clostridia bacterium]|nr:DUF5711 family protein [Clostridia bacterium]
MAKRDYDDELISTGRKRKQKKKKIKNDVPQNGVKVDLRVTEKPRNRYYLAAAGKYRAARYVTVILLAVFLFVMLLFFRENITYSNLMYLVRDLDTDNLSSAGSFAGITYDGQYAEKFALFKGRIAVAGTTGLTLYDSSGSKEAEYDCSYTNPGLEVSEKYALMYDAGDKSYSVYTSVARVLSEKSDQIIEAASVSDSGYYALLTRSEEAKFLVTVYNGSFKPVTKYYKDKYVIDLALNKTGSEAAIVSAAADNSSVYCEVSMCKIGTEETVSLNLDGLMPVSARYADDGSLFVMCDTALLSFRDGELSWRHDFTGMTPVCFDINKNTAAVTCSENAVGSVNAVLVFDINGNVLYNITLEHKISATVTDGESAVYAVGDGKADRIDLSDGSVSSESVSVVPVKLLAPPGSLIVCGEGGTSSHFTG